MIEGTHCREGRPCELEGGQEAYRVLKMTCSAFDQKYQRSPCIASSLRHSFIINPLAEWDYLWPSVPFSIWSVLRGASSVLSKSPAKNSEVLSKVSVLNLEMLMDPSVTCGSSEAIRSLDECFSNQRLRPALELLRLYPQFGRPFNVLHLYRTAAEMCHYPTLVMVKS